METNKPVRQEVRKEIEEIVYYFQDMNLGGASLLFFGYQKCPPGQFNTPHLTPPYYLLVYIRSGKGVFHTAHTSYSLGPGCTFCLFPGEITYYQADEQEPWEYYWIACNGELKHKSMEEILLKAFITKLQPVHMAKGTEALEQLYRSVFELCKDSDTFTEFRLFSLFLELLHQYTTIPNCYSHSSPQKALFLNRYVTEALDYIRLHYQEDISVSHIAEQLGISREYFSSIFTKQVHTSPACFLREYRLRCSSTLLATTDYPASQIAYMVGFHDYSYYSNQFHSQFGISPSQYRKYFRITGS